MPSAWEPASVKSSAAAVPGNRDQARAVTGEEPEDAGVSSAAARAQYDDRSEHRFDWHDSSRRP